MTTETFLEELFLQLPPVTIDGKQYPVNFEWGSQDDLNLFMTQKLGNKYPLIWLVQDREHHVKQETDRPIKLILAVNSKHKTNRNPTVWKTEFREVLDPLLENVKIAFKRNGVSRTKDEEFYVYREANYSEDEKNKTIDHWNVITLEFNLFFDGVNQCINTINFNL